MPRLGEWYTTSDRVELSDGLLTPLGRSDSLVKVLGELVDPEAIERELMAISEGRLVAGTFAVIGVPDERAGNVLVPVFESSVDADLFESSASSYNQSAAGFRRLQLPVRVDSFPRSDLGKLRRAELVLMCRKRSC